MELYTDYFRKDAAANLAGFSSSDPGSVAKRTYYGLSAKIKAFAKACTYVAPGSEAVCVDTQERFMMGPDLLWYKENGSGSIDPGTLPITWDDVVDHSESVNDSMATDESLINFQTEYGKPISGSDNTLINFKTEY